MTQKLLATDLDGTFIGDDAAMLALWDALRTHEILVVFSTGRHLQSIEKFYARMEQEAGMPGDFRSDASICMVGTDIYFRADGTYHNDPRWHEIISEDWEKSAVEGILKAIPEATMQDAQWQSPFKSSYFLEENAEARLHKIHEQLERTGLRAKVVFSAGKYLDLLPINSGKGEAVKYVARHYGIEPADVITCGDTGNDLDMMRSGLGVRSIAVGNAAEELKALRAPHVYHAQAFYAAGIREGLESYGWL